MARSTRSSDIVEICLILSLYNPDTSMTEVIENIEKYEQENNCYFGTGYEDMRSAFYWFAYNLGLVDMSDFEKLPKLMENIKLREWIVPILVTRELYFNDEGEYWEGEYKTGDLFTDSEDNWYDDVINPVDIKYEYRIREFFSNPDNYTSELIIKFFNKYKGDWDVLAANSLKK